jgi:hypothetical protein
MAKADYNYMYNVTDSGGVYTLGSEAKSSVTVTDTKDGPGDSKKFLGDVPDDQFKISHAGSLNGADYHFISVANIGNVTGFIGEEGGNYYFFTNQNANGDSGDHLNLDPDLVVRLCFMAGTLILTADTEIAVEDLRIGDLVKTTDGRAIPVRWIGRQTVAPLFADKLRLPIRVKAGAFGDNVPCRDLLLSPDHALLVDGVLAHAGALLNGTSIVRESNVPNLFTYYHVEVDDHSLILAENTPAETFIDNADRANFDNWREFEELYPEGKSIVEMPYPRAKAHRQVPRTIRETLAARGVALYGAPIASAA